MTDPLDPLLARSRDAIRLTDAEKARGRALLATRMQANPLPVASPFMPWLSPWVRGGVLATVFLMLGATGVAAASADALPHEPLYAVKVGIVEPVRIAVTLDPKARAALQVELADTRLKEIARASVEHPLPPEAAERVASLLSEHIESAQETISALDTNRKPADALELAAELQATLESHAEVLTDVDASTPAINAPLTAVQEILEREAEQTRDLAEEAATGLEDIPESELAEPVADHAEETGAALDAIAQDISGIATLDADEQRDVQASLADIRATLASSTQARAAGDLSATARLLADADRALTDLRTEIEADAALGIDVIDSD